MNHSKQLKYKMKIYSKTPIYRAPIYWASLKYTGRPGPAPILSLIIKVHV